MVHEHLTCLEWQDGYFLSPKQRGDVISTPSIHAGNSIAYVIALKTLMFSSMCAEKKIKYNYLYYTLINNSYFQNIHRCSIPNARYIPLCIIYMPTGTYLLVLSPTRMLLTLLVMVVVLDVDFLSNFSPLDE